MRIPPSTSFSISKNVRKLAPDSECFLFGSRTNDAAKGGDIDLLLLTEEKLPLPLISRIRRIILNEIGEQKIDIVNIAKTSSHPFKAIALETAIRL